MIYIAAHKQFNNTAPSNYRVLQVGAEGKADLGYLRDNSGDNISVKNPTFCELTGLYWMWKHVDDDYIGLVHYRRYFCRSLNSKKILSENDIKKKLRDHDIIVPFPMHLKNTLTEQYCEVSGFERDLLSTREVISEICPEYLHDFDTVMNGKSAYFFNMMIAGNQLFKDYCEWLFAILFKLEKRCDLTGYNSYQQRIFGFIAERLLNVYIVHNKCRVCEVGVVNTDKHWPFPKNFLVTAKRVIRFWFS